MVDESNIRTILALLNQSIDLLYENDHFLIKNGVHEQDISHRIAYYLENLLRSHDWFVKSRYSIDVEYNRNLNNTKKFYDNCSNKEIKCRPDIIIHERGVHKFNLIVIEIKKGENYSENDFSKLCALTNEQLNYKYKLGIFINITSQKSELQYKYFKNGQAVSEAVLQLS